MKNIVIAFGLFVLAVGPVGAEDKSQVMAPVKQFCDGFNKGDTKSALAACADPICIIDDFPPHAWHGTGATAKWMADYEANAKKNGISDGFVKLRSPRHMDITGDHAYVVVPADYSYKQNGRTVKQRGSLLTVALQKGEAGWRIIGWSWSKN